MGRRWTNDAKAALVRTEHLLTLLDRDGFGGKDCYGRDNRDRIWSHKASLLRWTVDLSHLRDSVTDPTNVNAPTNLNRHFSVSSMYCVASSLRNKCHSNIIRVGIIVHEIAT